MRILVGSFFFVIACASSPSSAVPPMQPAPNVTCPTTFADAVAHPVQCDTELRSCDYDDGTCRCKSTIPEFVCTPRPRP
jgi:hypothetical protein